MGGLFLGLSGLRILSSVGFICIWCGVCKVVLLGLMGYWVKISIRKGTPLRSCTLLGNYFLAPFHLVGSWG